MHIPGAPVYLAIMLWPGALPPLAGVPAMAAPNGQVAAPEPAPLAVIHETAGTVSVQKAGDPAPLPAEEDMDLGPGDRITTGTSGRITLSLRDAHFVKLGGLATLTVREIRSDQVAGEIWARLALARGKLMAVVSGLASPDSRFEVETPSAVAAVKGTSFQVSAGTKSTTISVLEGVVVASGSRDAPVLPEELEVREGFETVVNTRTHRPGALTKFFNNEKRKKARIALSEFRARIQKLKARGQSGELQRQRRLRVLSRALLIQRFQKKNPETYKALPDWRRARLDRFLDGHRPELDASRAEVNRFLNSNAKTRKRLELEANRRFSGVKGAGLKPSARRSGAPRQVPPRQKKRTTRTTGQ